MDGSGISLLLWERNYAQAIATPWIVNYKKTLINQKKDIRFYFSELTS